MGLENEKHLPVRCKRKSVQVQLLTERFVIGLIKLSFLFSSKISLESYARQVKWHAYPGLRTYKESIIQVVEHSSKPPPYSAPSNNESNNRKIIMTTTTTTTMMIQTIRKLLLHILQRSAFLFSSATPWPSSIFLYVHPIIILDLKFSGALKTCLYLLVITNSLASTSYSISLYFQTRNPF